MNKIFRIFRNTDSPWFRVLLLVMPPFFLSTFLSALYMAVDAAAGPGQAEGFLQIPIIGACIWLVWLIGIFAAIRGKSGTAALCIAVYLFGSCGFYGLAFAASYDIFTFPLVIRAFFLLIGTPYSVLASGLQGFLPENGIATMLTCVAYLLLVIVAAGYAFRASRKK